MDSKKKPEAPNGYKSHRRFLSGALIAVALLLSPTPASAIVFDFVGNSPHAGNLGNTEVYTVGSISITATDFGIPNAFDSTPNLFGKNAGVGEMGLGLTNDPDRDNEIGAGAGFIQLDLNQLLANGLTNIQILMDSVTNGERWNAYLSNTAASSPAVTPPGSLLYSDTTQNFSPILALAGNRYLNINSSNGNVLLHKISAVAAPEPVTMLTLGTGLAIAALSRRRKRMA